MIPKYFPHDTDENDDLGELHYASNTSIHAIKRNQYNYLIPEELIKSRNIGLKTAALTLKTTTHQCIQKTNLLIKRFKTDKPQLLYKQLSYNYGTFYADYLKAYVMCI